MKTTLPESFRAAAALGLVLWLAGKAGDGLREKTVKEAIRLTRGDATPDKLIRMNAWAARHESDLDAPAAKKGHPEYPSPGVVAHLLWGLWPPQKGSESRYEAQRAWLEEAAAAAKEPEG